MSVVSSKEAKHALFTLYLAAPESIVRTVSLKINTYIEALEAECAAQRAEVVRLKEINK